MLQGITLRDDGSDIDILCFADTQGGTVARRMALEKGSAVFPGLPKASTHGLTRREREARQSQGNPAEGEAARNEGRRPGKQGNAPEQGHAQEQGTEARPQVPEVAASGPPHSLERRIAKFTI